MKQKTKSFLQSGKLLTYYHTLKYLKWQQFFYRVYHPIKHYCYRKTLLSPAQLSFAQSHKKVIFRKFSNDKGLLEGYPIKARFLNQTKVFPSEIEWAFSGYGLLWTFHLHYFDWLQDKSLSIDFRLSTILQWIENQREDGIYVHPYPSSLRIMNWVKFLLENDVSNSLVYSSLYIQADRLRAFPEYRLMANHLLSNGFALLWAGLYFKEQRFVTLGQRILTEQLKEQLLEDGMHFERSISYHSILLKNMLETIFILNKYTFDINFIKMLIFNSNRMLSNLMVHVIDGTQYPYWADANPEMGINVGELRCLAQDLQLSEQHIELSDSGYRKLGGLDFCLFFNSGKITASYQPGHSHADALSVCLYVNKLPFIVDRGVSTYEASEQRSLERSTAAHNTLCMMGQDSAVVWAAFRMGQRPNIRFLDDTADYIRCVHDGYKDSLGLLHERSVIFEENEFKIIDIIEGYINQEAYLYFHLYPGVQVVAYPKGWQFPALNCIIELDAESSYLEDYQYAMGFNKTITASRIVCPIRQKEHHSIIRRYI